MDSMPLKEAQELAITHVCGECAGELTVPWGGSEFKVNSHVLVCGVDHSHEGIVKKGTVPLEDQPIYVQDAINKKERNRMVEEHGEEVGMALAEFQGSTSLTQKQAAFILRKCWQDAPDEAVMRGAMICAQYGLNPLMKHLYLIGFDRKDKASGKVVGKTWVPVLGIGATRLMASRAAKKRGMTYGFHDGPRMMRAEEQREIFGEEFRDRFMAICYIKDNSGQMAPGYGSWPNGSKPYGDDKGNTKQNMAFIRCERNAFDRMFPGEMPDGDIDVVDLAFAGELIQEAPATLKPAKKLSAPPNQGARKPKVQILTKEEAASEAGEKAALAATIGHGQAADQPAGPQGPQYSKLDEALNKIRMGLKLLNQDEFNVDFVNYLKGRFGTGVLDELDLNQADLLLQDLTKKVVEGQKVIDADQEARDQVDKEAKQ